MASDHDPDPYFSTYVVEFVIRPKYFDEKKRDGGTTFMRIWEITPGVNKSNIDKRPGGKRYASVSLGDACIFKLLNQDLRSEQEFPNEPAKRTQKAETFIRYLLGQIHKFLHNLKAVPKQYPRTFAVYLQWCPPCSRVGGDLCSRIEEHPCPGVDEYPCSRIEEHPCPRVEEDSAPNYSDRFKRMEEWKKNEAPKQFQKVRQAINAAYFADGVRFRLVQDTPPLEEDGSGHLFSDDDWPQVYKKFEDLVRGEFKINLRDVAVVLQKDDSPTSTKQKDDSPTSTKQIVVYVYRYWSLSNEYSRMPHKTVQKHHICQDFSDDEREKTVRDAVQEVCAMEEYSISHILTNIEEIPLSQVQKAPEIYNSFKPKLKKKKNSTEYEDIADEVCMHMSRKTQYGVILDAGSSGTRSYVYEWERRFDARGGPVLPESMTPLKVPNAKKNGGIAKLWDGGPTGLEKRVERYLTELIKAPSNALINLGVKGVLDTDGRPKLPPSGAPSSDVHISRVPLYVLATGGMRELREKDGQGYIRLRNAVANYLNRTGYLEPTYDTISGEAEGIFGWLDVNFAPNTFIPTNPSEETKPYGLVEMGGQTVQLAFTRKATDDDKNPWGNYEGPLTYIDLGPQLKYHVFSKSWGALGNQAMWTEHWTRILERGKDFIDACVPKNGTYEVDYQLITGSGSFVDTMKEVYEMFHCRDTGCSAGDLCLARLHRGCLLNEIDGLELSHESEKTFIGVSSMSHAMRYLGLGKLDVNEFFTAATKRYSEKEFSELVKQRREELEKKLLIDKKLSIDELMDEMIKEKDYLLKEMFTAGLALTMTLVGMGIPMGPYARGCVQLASTWFQVERQCLEAGTSPVPSLLNRIRNLVPSAFPDHFPAANTQEKNPLELMTEAIVRKYLAGAEEHSQGHALIEQLLKLDKNKFAKDPTLASKIAEALQLIMDKVKSHPDRYEKPYYDSDTNTIGNPAFRELCFHFVSNCLDWKADAELGTTIIKGNDDASWTRGKMLLHSVATTAQNQSVGGWGAVIARPRDIQDQA